MTPPKEKQTFYSIIIDNVIPDVTGRKRTPAGYIALCIKSHPNSDKVNGYVFEHRVVMEMKLGRYLKEKEVVHHINGVKHDNRLVNLEVMNHGDHTIMHHKGTKRSREVREKISLITKERLSDKKNHPFYKEICKETLMKLLIEKGPKKVSEDLGVTRKTVYNKIDEFGLKEWYNNVK